MRVVAGFFVVVLACWLGGVASADLGAPVADVVAGPVRIVAFASPVPLRVGSSQWRVFALDPATGAPLRDVELRVGFERPVEDDPHAAHRHAPPPRPAAIGRSDVTARVDFDTPGAWQWQVHVAAIGEHDDPPAAAPIVIHEAVEVLPRLSFWRTHGAAVVAPYAMLALVAGHRRFVLRRRRRVSRSHD